MSRGRPLVALALVYAAVRAFSWFAGQPWSVIDYSTAESGLELIIWVVPAVVATAVLSRTTIAGAWRQMGLTTAPASGLLFGLVATVPMACAALYRPGGRFDLDILAGSVVLGPFAEEVLFRGFLFTELRRRWPFSVAVVVSSLAFGLAHVSGMGLDTMWYLATAWSDPAHLWASVWQVATTWLGTSFLEILVTALAGALFAVVSWRLGSLWPAIGLHACMNLWWSLAHGEGVRIDVRPDASAVAQASSIGVALLLAYWRPVTALGVKREAS